MGLLRDSNRQKNKFFNEQPNYVFAVDDIVQYEISLNSYGLIAVGVVIVTGINGEIVKPHTGSQVKS